MQASFVKITDSPEKKKYDEGFGSSATECTERDLACRILGVSSHITDVLL